MIMVYISVSMTKLRLHIILRHQDNAQLFQSLPYHQGKVLGGSSSINYMVYIRGSIHDYDSWEDYGAEGWNFKSVEHNFRNVEYARGQYMPKNMGKNGRVKLSNTYNPKSQLTKLVDGIARSFG